MSTSFPTFFTSAKIFTHSSTGGPRYMRFCVYAIERWLFLKNLGYYSQLSLIFLHVKQCFWNISIAYNEGNLYCLHICSIIFNKKIIYLNSITKLHWNLFIKTSKFEIFLPEKYVFDCPFIWLWPNYYSDHLPNVHVHVCMSIK